MSDRTHLASSLLAAGLAAAVAAIGAGGFLAGRAGADQPQMQKALEYLREARKSLQEANSDKGGHRNKALDLVREAMDQVEKGIRYDRRDVGAERRKRDQ